MVERLGKWASTWLSSEINENGFRVLRKSSRASDNNAMSRPQRWAQLVESSLIIDHGREPVIVSPSARLVGLGVSTNDNSLYSADTVHENDMPHERYASITADPDCYPHLTPQAFHANGLRWVAYVESSSFTAMQHAWYSIMLQPGWLVRNAAKRISGVVVQATQHYAVVVKVKLIDQTSRTLVWDVENAACSSMFSVISVDSMLPCWQILQTTGVAPWKVLSTCGVNGAFQFAMQPSSGSMLLGVAAARIGFRGLTVDWLEKLFKEAGVLGKRPAREADLVRSLVKHYLPDVTDAEMDAILEARKSGLSEPIQSVLTHGPNLELALDAIPVDDADEVEKSVKKRKTPSDVPEPPASPSRGSGPSGLPPPRPPGGQPVLRIAHCAPRIRNLLPRPMADDRLTIDWARTLVPQGRQCRLDIDETLHHRWKLEYTTSNTEEQQIFTRVWNADRTALQALVQCVEWAWARHFKICGEKCPFVIQSLPDIIMH
jgi:hypothetical protein